MAKNFSGGPWTSRKLRVLQDYLNFYTTALKARSFRLVYFDAFAGTGDRSGDGENSQANLMFDDDAEQMKKGSARIALEINHAFDAYIFVEKNAARFRELTK